MAGPEGLEPPTTWFEARYSIQLSYRPAEPGRYSKTMHRYTRSLVVHDSTAIPQLEHGTIQAAPVPDSRAPVKSAGLHQLTLL